jgi:hypothetical protein
MPITGTSALAPYWPDALPVPLTAKSVLFANAAHDGWIQRPMQLRRDPAQSRNIQMFSGPGAFSGTYPDTRWTTFADLGEPNHQAHEQTNTYLVSDNVLHGGAHVVIPVVAAHVYLVTVSAQMSWDPAAAVGSVRIGVEIDGRFLHAESFAASLHRNGYGATFFWTALASNPAQRFNIAYGQSLPNIHTTLDASSIDVVEAR